MDSLNPYPECLEYMYSLRRFGIILGLDTISIILNTLGNPQDTFSCIHVSGTNGKGSIASALSTILALTGRRVGLYTSPHLVRFNERIAINGEPINDAAVIEAHDAVRKAASGGREPTFFEYTTAMAFHYFARKKVDWAIIETGMGGRMDATNVVKPVLSIISNVSLEHQVYLGKTIAKIAYEKAGIIKAKTPVVTGVRQPSALGILTRVADEKKVPLFRFGTDFRVHWHVNNTFTYFGIQKTWPDMKTGLLGRHQAENAAITLAACEILNEKGLDIPETTLRKGLKENRWPGRLEIVSKDPLVILDGAHNRDAARKLAEFLTRRFPDKNVLLVLGILDDKPYQIMLKALLPTCHRVILTRASIDRALPTQTLLKYARTLCRDIEVIDDAGKALRHAVATAGPDQSICVAGSLYVVGDVKAAIEKDPSLLQRPGSKMEIDSYPIMS